MTSIIMIIFVILLLISIPIGIAVGITAMLPSLLTDSFTVSGVYILRSMVGGMNQTTLLAIPLFVLSGIIMAKGEISKKLFDVFSYFIGKKTAGIPCAVVITCLFFGAISGSAPATVAAVGSMTIPLMLEMGYDKKFTVALVAVAGGLGVIIPPSIPFILYAQAAGVSVSDMFLAGIIPGLIIALVLMVYSWVYCKRHGEDKSLINAKVDALHEKSFGKVFVESIFALLSPVIILGCIYSGITSPTEAAAISVFYALLVSMLIYKTIKFKDLWPIFVEGVKTYAPILFILAASVAFSRIITLMRVPQSVSTWMTTTINSKVVLLLIINVILLIVGMIMDTTPAIMILTPILLPAAQAVGMDAVHFGIMMVVNLAIGFVTPPIGVNLFVASSLSQVPVMQIAQKVMPMIVLFILVLLLITFVPGVSLFLIG